MSKKEHKLLIEVNSIIKMHKNNLVLIERTDQDSYLTYYVTDKYTQSFFILDDENVAQLLIQVLLESNVEIFQSWEELAAKYKKQLEKPFNWPENQPWPPEAMK